MIDVTAPSDSSSTIGSRELGVASVMFGLFAVVTIVQSVRTGSMLNYVSGVWLTLASDAASGTLYRPLVSDSGFGGTRYFPLTFLVIAGLIRIGVPPVIAGHLVMLVAAAGLVVGVYRLLRVLEVPRDVAWPSAGLAFCTFAGLFALVTIRGDILAAALNIWGLVFGARLLRPDGRPSNEWAAAACFCLAFLAKSTTLFGLAAVATALFLRGGGSRLRAFRLVISAVGAAVVVLALVNVASDGRMLESLRATATGGAGRWQLFMSPLEVLNDLVRQD